MPEDAPYYMSTGMPRDAKMRLCPRSCTQHRTKSGRLAERRTFDGRRCTNCGFATDPEGASRAEVRFEKASDL